MYCLELEDGSDAWLPCIGSSISSNQFCQGLPPQFCQGLPPNLFDIEVLDDQDTQIQQFEGSTALTTIQNLEAGTYTVNEIKHTNGLNQLGQDSTVQQRCISTNGFTDGGTLRNTNAGPLFIDYNICFEYEDEQGNDCNTVTLAPGEEKTCTVKNYINFARLFD